MQNDAALTTPGATSETLAQYALGRVIRYPILIFHNLTPVPRFSGIAPLPATSYWDITKHVRAPFRPMQYFMHVASVG